MPRAARTPATNRQPPRNQRPLPVHLPAGAQPLTTSLVEDRELNRVVYLTKATWAALVESAGPWTGSEPRIGALTGSMTVRTYADVRRGPEWGHASLSLRPTAGLWAWLRDNLISIDYDSIGFSLVAWEDGNVLVIARHNQIIGSRWLTILPAAELPADVRAVVFPEPEPVT